MAAYPILEGFQLPTTYLETKQNIVELGSHWREYLPKGSLVVVFPGFLDHDILESFKRWEDTLADYLVIVAGIHTESGRKQMMELASANNVIHKWQIDAGMTPDQAIWTKDQIVNLDVSRVGLYAPEFHLPRATMTLAKALEKANINCQIHPISWKPSEKEPLKLNGFDNLPMYGELIPGEEQRWVKYTEGGDVLGPEKWPDYKP